MGLVVLVAAGVLGWLWWSDQLGAIRPQTIAAAVVAALALRFIALGEALPAAASAGVAALLYWRQGPKPVQLDLDEARLLLDVDIYADADAIRAAHRRIIARVHPDAGGSAELARRVNAARDLLLKRLNERKPQAS